MANNIEKYTGLIVDGTICPDNSASNMATHKAQFGKGGWRTVSSFNDLTSSIMTTRRQQGMAVYVTENNKLYILSAANISAQPLLSSDWYQFKSGLDLVSGTLSVSNLYISGVASASNIYLNSMPDDLISQLEQISGTVEVKMPSGNFLSSNNPVGTGTFTINNINASNIISGNDIYLTQINDNVVHQLSALSAAIDSKAPGTVSGNTTIVSTAMIISGGLTSNGPMIVNVDPSSPNYINTSGYCYSYIEVISGINASNSGIVKTDPDSAGQLSVSDIYGVNLYLNYAQNAITHISSLINNIKKPAEQHIINNFIIPDEVSGIYNVNNSSYYTLAGKVTAKDKNKLTLTQLQPLFISDLKLCLNAKQIKYWDTWTNPGVTTELSCYFGPFYDFRAKNGKAVPSQTDVHTVSYKYAIYSIYNTTLGDLQLYSHCVALGKDCTAAGEASFAANVSNIAGGRFSFAVNNTNIALGDSSFAQGHTTSAMFEYSHTQGDQTYAQGKSSHAEGRNTIAHGAAQHAEGYYTETYNGINKNSWSYKSDNIDVGQHVEGRYNTPVSSRAIVVGAGNLYGTNGYLSAYQVIKTNLFNNDKNKHLLSKSIVSSVYNNSPISGTYNVYGNIYELDWKGNATYAGAVSASKILTNEFSINTLSCENLNVNNKINNNLYISTSQISASTSLRINSSNKPIFICGQNCYLDNLTEKNNVIILGNGCSGIGKINTSFIQGQKNIISGSTYSHIEGLSNVISGGRAIHVEGYCTKAGTSYQHVQGKYNVKSTGAFVIGGGNSELDRKNIYELDWSGNSIQSGVVSAARFYDTTLGKVISGGTDGNYLSANNPAFSGSLHSYNNKIIISDNGNIVCSSGIISASNIYLNNIPDDLSSQLEQISGAVEVIIPSGDLNQNGIISATSFIRTGTFKTPQVMSDNIIKLTDNNKDIYTKDITDTTDKNYSIEVSNILNGNSKILFISLSDNAVDQTISFNANSWTLFKGNQYCLVFTNINDIYYLVGQPAICYK